MLRYYQSQQIARFRTVVIAAFSGVAFMCANAQPVVVSPPNFSSPGAGFFGETPDDTPSEEGAEPMAEILDAFAAKNPLQWGPVQLHPHFSYQFLYGTGIQARPGDQKDTIIQNISPGILFELGERWTLDYTPTAVLYSDPAFEDSLNHSIRLDGRTSYEEWTLGFAQTCQISSDPQTETGGQTDQQAYLTSFNAAYQLNSRVSVEAGLSQNVRVVEGFAHAAGTTWDWSLLNWLNWQWNPVLATSLGAGLSYTEVEAGSDMTAEQIHGRVILRAARKLSVSANAGLEFRQFLDSNRSDLISPVFGLAVAYRPFETTELALAANRSITPSHFQDEAAENTSFTANFKQRFFRRYHLGMTGGLHNTRYISSVSGGGTSRDDDRLFGSVSVGTSILRRGTASIFYSVSENTSSQGRFEYSSRQVGAQLTYSY